MPKNPDKPKSPETSVEQPIIQQETSPVELRQKRTVEINQDLEFLREDAEEQITETEGVEIANNKNELLQAKKILEYTGKELPESETRIQEKMRPECMVAISIPAYEEGAKILNSLQFLSRQEGVSKEEYEVIVNVNNRENAGKNTRGSNRQTLDILKYLKGEKANVDFLSAEERNRLEKIKESGTVVHYIDKSSDGNETKPIDDRDFQKIGCTQPRKRTMDEIAERFVLAGKADGIIASLDADTKVSAEWIKQIIESFKDKNIKMVAGERRDGIDLNENGEMISRDDVTEQLLDDWNTESRKKDEIFKDLPDIKNRFERAEIILMGQLIGAYNAARGHYRRKKEGKTGAVEDFKGGSGKMFRASTYVEHPLDIIKIMDAGGKKPENIEDGNMLYQGRKKSEQSGAETADPAIEALAVYPESRVRSWDVKSDNVENPYGDFENIHKPFGSSGKETAYAIAAVLKEKIPTTYNEEADDIKDAIKIYATRNSEEAKKVLEKHFDEKEILQIKNISAEELGKLEMSGPIISKKYKGILDRVRELSKPISIIDAIEYYARKNPKGETFNPERNYFGVLVKQLQKSGGKDRDNIADRIKDLYDLGDKTIEELSKIDNENDLFEFVKNNQQTRKVLDSVPQKITFSEAAEKYRKLFNF